MVVPLVVVVVVAGLLTTAVPLAETLYHLAPKALLPSPFVCPDFLSSAQFDSMALNQIGMVRPGNASCLTRKFGRLKL